MLPQNLNALDKEARALRTAELQRIQEQFFAKASTYLHLLAAAAQAGLTAISHGLRHLFSWNPQAR